jgi:hypothetical protein
LDDDDDDHDDDDEYITKIIVAIIIKMRTPINSYLIYVLDTARISLPKK